MIYHKAVLVPLAFYLISAQYPSHTMLLQCYGEYKIYNWINEAYLLRMMQNKHIFIFKLRTLLTSNTSR